MMTLRETMAQLIAEGCELKRNHRGRVDFKVSNDGTLIDDIDMPNRAKNALKRNHIETVGQLIDVFNKGNMAAWQGIGEKTVREAKQAIIEWNWSMMNVPEKREYLETLFV